MFKDIRRKWKYKTAISLYNTTRIHANAMASLYCLREFVVDDGMTPEEYFELGRKCAKKSRRGRKINPRVTELLKHKFIIEVNKIRKFEKALLTPTINEVPV